ncbi:transcriptional regulator, Crp/Fnr family [Paraburkholderia unamae]|uniref:Crp/Fnr family transcriptional regulator n=1 Tax=Paraburkholderia unamae TaxID=219649 RepID=UPI001CB42968|nr:Crp/Fnr family transcriptional regulator [Paraburkholderia unamae]CAG9274842.1 transcriptional regulator, Crp/Fnr family [Paraburkholderia unamae]
MREDFNLKEYLRAQFLLKSSDNDTIELARTMARVEKVKAEDYLVIQGDKTSPLVLLLTGQLRTCVLTEDGRELPLHMLHAGDATGAVSIIQGIPSTKNVVAVKPSVVALINRADARRLFSAPTVTRELNAMFASLIQGVITEQNATGSAKSTARVCAILYAMFREAGSKQDSPVELPTHSSLASVAQVSRETVTRVLGLLSRREIIVKERQRIFVRKPEALQLLASGSTIGPEGAGE